MKKQLLSGLIFAVSIPAFAAVQTPAQELAASSQLPLGEIQETLAKCDSVDETTQDMYFCAWRDLIVAERDLQKVIDQRNSQRPERKAALNTRIAHWKKARAADCKKSAHRELAGGSLEPVEALGCQVEKTVDMVRTMKEDHAAIPCKKSVDVCHDGALRQ